MRDSKQNALAVTAILIMGTSLGASAATPTVSQTVAPPTSAFSCVDLRKAAQKLPVYASNIKNWNTTRTPEGGPYKRVDLVCKEMFCESIAKDDFKLVQDPKHPDANGAGYVRLPRIDVSSEYAALTSAAAEVKLLAATGACGASALESPTMALIKYDKGASILSDSFNFSSEGRLVSWSRTLSDGTSQHMAFNTDGTSGTSQ